MTSFQVESDEQFVELLQSQGSKLIVIDFFATWCGPCQRLKPALNSMVTKYPTAAFLFVDVDKCQQAKTTFQITAMPTIVIFKGSELERVRGANAALIEQAIQTHLNSDGAGAGQDSVVKGQYVLNEFLTSSATEILNCKEGVDFKALFENSATTIESDADEQLIIAVGFNQPIKLHSIRLIAPNDGRSPMTVKLFQNVLVTPDFDDVESIAETESITFAPPSSEDGQTISVHSAKFQNVQKLVLFIADNVGGDDETALSYLEFIGTLRDSTNMKDFKRLAGQAGEYDM